MEQENIDSKSGSAKDILSQIYETVDGMIGDIEKATMPLFKDVKKDLNNSMKQWRKYTENKIEFFYQVRKKMTEQLW